MMSISPRTRIICATAALACLLMAPMAFAEPVATAQQADSGLYIVRFSEDSLAMYRGGVAGLAPTNARSLGARKLDARSPASRAYLDFLAQRQTVHLDTIEQHLGRAVEVRHYYRAVLNGVAARIDASEAAAVAQLPGVLSVTKDEVHSLDTDTGPAFIGAPAIWDGIATAGLMGSKGEGVVLGILDGGLNQTHPSFSDSPSDGHTYINPFGSGTFSGWCDPGHPNFDAAYACNDKRIGGWDYADASWGDEADGPGDNGGHGSHTASTAGGNTLDSPAVSGVAPHASIINFDVCGLAGMCFTSDSIAATNQAVMDGVDVINFSIGGGGNPWGDADSGFLDAVTAGVFVAASSGNGGPGPGTTGHRGPWVTTVGNSTHDRVNNENDLTSMSGGTSPPADVDGASLTGGYGPAPIVYAGDFANGDVDPEQCLNPFPPGTWTSGEIVLCDRGTIARVLKCQNVRDGGAAGCVLANVSGGAATIVGDAHVIPSTHIGDVDGDAVRAWLASGSGHMATITDSALVTDPAVGDIMAGSSSRGPTTINVIKPDLTNPGSNIFAAVNADAIPGFTGPPFGFLSGTSMSSPHVAGSAALLIAVHPSWTPMQVRSALMMTADTTVFKENGSTDADPFDYGGGRVDLTKAAETGLVMDETGANFLAANPATGGDPRTLNIPSFQDSACDGTCGFSRTLTKTTFGAGSSWTTGTTDPTAGINLTAALVDTGATVELQVTIDVVDDTPTGFVFGEVQLFADNPDLPDLHIPVAIIPTGTSSLIFADGFEGGDAMLWSGSLGL